LPNSPQAGSDMLNNMIASFSASNQVGEFEKEVKRNFKRKNIELPEKQKLRKPRNRRFKEFIKRT
jgi:hypothetical protein